MTRPQPRSESAPASAPGTDAADHTTDRATDRATAAAAAAAARLEEPGPALRQRPRLAATVFTLAVGAGLTVWACQQAHDAAQSRAQQRFQDTSSQIHERIQRRLQAFRYALQTVRGAFIASDDVDADTFNRLFNPVHLAADLPGLMGLGYADYRPEDPDRPFRIRHLNPAIGLRASFDLNQDPAATAAIAATIASGTPAVFPALNQPPPGGPHGSPRSSPHAGPRAVTHVLVLANTDRDRQPPVRGVIVMPIDLKAVVQPVSAQYADTLSIQLAMKTAAPAAPSTARAAEKRLTKGWPSGVAYKIAPGVVAGTGAIRTEAAGDQASGDQASGGEASGVGVGVGASGGGGAWTLTIQRVDGSFGAQGAQTWLTAAVGGLLTICLSASVFYRDAAAHRARREARRMTTDLRRLAIVAERTTNAVVITDERFRLTWCNQGFTQMTGHALASAYGTRPTGLLAGPATRPSTLQAIERTLESHTGYRGQIRLQRRDGRPFWASADIQPVHATDNHGYILTLTDISEQIADRRRIKESEALLAETGRVAGVGGWDIDLTTNELRWTPETRRIHEVPADYRPTIERAIRFYADETRHVMEQAVGEGIRTGKPWDLQLPLITAKGRRIWVRAAGQAQYDADGKPTRLFGAFQDITGAVDAQRQAKEALEKLSGYQNAIDTHSILGITDAKGVITEVNDLFCQISGYRRDELIGQTHRIINSGHHPKSFWREMWQTISNGCVWRAEVCNRRKDGSLYWVDTSVSPIFNADGKIAGYCAVRTDITGIKRTQEALLEARIAADAASTSKSEFLANMSHEIRTPLTAILGYAQLLEDEDAGFAPDQRSDTLKTIRRAGEHLLLIINDILDLSKIEAGKLQVETVPTPLLQIVRDVTGLMKPHTQSSAVKLSAQIVGRAPDVILSDPTRLRQILMNLVGNATKFTDQGTIQIQIQTIDAALADAPMTLRIQVIDTGVGMTAEHARRLFQLFSQADTSVTRRFGGTGLGLTICRRLAGLLGGHIWLEHSAPGQGSTFAFELPLSPADHAVWHQDLHHLPNPASTAPAAPVAPAALPPTPPTPHPAPTTAPAPATHSPTAAPGPDREPPPLGRVLLAEDGPDNQRLIKHFLEKAGADVTLADDGLQALNAIAQAQQAGTRFDLIITDIQMPNMDGYTLMQRLKDAGNPTPVVALTAHAMREDQQRCFQAGCAGYATKPINRHHLIATCQAAIAPERRPEPNGDNTREKNRLALREGQDAAPDDRSDGEPPPGVPGAAGLRPAG